MKATMNLQVMSMLLLFCGTVPLSAAINDADPIVAKYAGLYKTPPDSVGLVDPSIHACRIPDGPLLGNGDLAVAIGGTYTNQTFYLSKSDMSHSARGIGGLTISFADSAGEIAKYRQEENLFKAEVSSVIPLHRATVRMRSWTADAGNILVCDLWTDEAVPMDMSIRLWSYTDRSAAQAGTTNGIIWSTREIVGTVGMSKDPFSSKVATAVRVLGAMPVCSTDGKKSSTAKFMVPAGTKVRIVTVVAGGYGVSNHVEQAMAAAAALNSQRIDELYADHAGWWKRYWLKSQVELGDALLEQFYYGALYVLVVLAGLAAFLPDWRGLGI